MQELEMQILRHHHDVALREGNDNCPYITAQYVQCWRDGHAQGKAELESGC
jgi:hypothetical protein